MQHDDLQNKLERQYFGYRTSPNFSFLSFNLSLFRRLAQEQLGSNWMALSYHLHEGHLSIAMLTQNNCHCWQRDITGSHFLNSLKQKQFELLNKGDLQIISQWLLPQECHRHLTPSTTLVIIPHRQLHQLPWATLPIKKEQIPLINLCNLTIIPSLQSLTLLWQRAAPTKPKPSNGLFIGISMFQNRRHPQLPASKYEINKLLQELSINCVSLLEQEATLVALQLMAKESNLGEFDVLHIASHAFYDRTTGRSSGLALADKDIWLNEFAELAPLPPLVTLSACSSVRSFVYEGDEHVDLPTTCLGAGAQSIVGSIWPVQDGATLQLMIDFYKHWEKGERVASALAMAQRMAWKRNEPWQNWGGFVCIGQP
ncbi:MAG: CHAT domain-containing protein [Chloroflexota bacterium]